MDWKKYVVEKYLGKTEGNYEVHKPEIQEKLFKDLTSADETKMYGAANIITSLDNLNFTKEQVCEIENKCSNLPKSENKSMRDYRQDVSAALMVINHFQEGAKCKCDIYQKWNLFPVEKEVELGYLKQLNEPFINHQKYQIEHELECEICSTKWQVNRNDGYHYPVWKWIKK